MKFFLLSITTLFCALSFKAFAAREPLSVGPDGLPLALSIAVVETTVAEPSNGINSAPNRQIKTRIVPGLMTFPRYSEKRQEGKPVVVTPEIEFNSGKEMTRQSVGWRHRSDFQALVRRLTGGAERNGSVLVELEDGTWALGQPQDFTVDISTERPRLYWPIQILELEAGKEGALTTTTRSIDVPLEEITNKVFIPAATHGALPAAAENQQFFIGLGAKTLPVTVLGYSRLYPKSALPYPAAHFQKLNEETAVAVVHSRSSLSVEGESDGVEFTIPTALLRTAPKERAKALLESEPVEAPELGKLLASFESARFEGEHWGALSGEKDLEGRYHALRQRIKATGVSLSDTPDGEPKDCATKVVWSTR